EVRAAGAAAAAVAWGELLAVPPAATHAGQPAPLARGQIAMQQPDAARHSVGGGRRAVAARIESAGGRSRARSGWTAAEPASSAALRSYCEARLWGGGGCHRVAVVGAVMALRLPGRPDETGAPAGAARSSRPSGQRCLSDGRRARFRRWCR